MDKSATRPLLILDLDETLVHGSEIRLHREADFMVGPFHVYKRPHLDEFLTDTSSHFDMAVWSSASWDYVSHIADELSTLVPKWQFVWSRFRCVQRMHPELMQTYFVKDLKKVKRRGYNLDRVLIVDDTQLKVSRNYGNAIYIPPFEGSDDDNELPQLKRYINSLRFESNFRTIEKRGWRTKSLSN
ncbi:HAD family hydrolase [Roseimaritima ulvae]|uniref:NLI interacting factor-like phosphatase n=1 Tax=Roseimaritima ulvae TaxID=980254 RepID=A0A5B9QM47_9BACT|nr:HAD family hydrolase [Roseimaritima ulvae]QEG40177.1 NLI interacting factor-like phosphatase [Roseimaritima ulvae]